MCFAFNSSLPKFKLIKKEVKVDMNQEHILKHVPLLEKQGSPADSFFFLIYF